MDTYKKNVSWKHAIEQNYCETLEWNRVCNDFIMRLYNEKDRSIIKMSINEVLSVLIIKCSNDNLSFRSAAEETIGKIFHFCVKYKLINYLSSITLIQIKEKELLPRSLKVCLVLLSNCVDSIKCTSVQNFVDNVFCNIIQKFDNMIHSICIESFVEFFKAFLTNLGFLLEQSYTEECLEIFILNLLNETVLVRHSITQCIHYLIQHCPNQQEKLAKKIVDRILVTLKTSMNDSKIIGMAELLKETSFIITQFEEYHSKLIEIIILGIKCCDKNVGVINAYIEMNIALFKTNNNLFHNSLSSYHLDSQNIPLSNFIISNLCSKFLYNTVDGTIRENVKISMQCNILEFVGVCCNISNQYILNNTLLIQTIIKLSDHSDFIVREKIVIILTELIHNNDDNIQNLQFCSILASQFDDSAFTVVSTLICQLGKYFNKVLQLYNKPHLNLNNMSFVVITMNKIMSYLDGHHWSVVCRICDFIVTMDFVEMRKHFDYITTKYYQDSFYSKLIKLVSSSDARIQKKAVTCLVKILRNMSTENNIYFCKTDFENFITDRYLNGQTIAIKHNFENLRQKSYILCELINLLATVNNQNLTGVISCIALCVNEIPQLCQFFVEYDLLSIILALMIENHCTAIDIHCQKDMFIILKNIIPGYFRNKSYIDVNLRLLTDHIFEILKIHLQVFYFEIKEKPNDANIYKQAMSYTTIYSKLYESIKSTFVCNQITINKTQMVKLFQLFKSSIEMFILLSNLYSVDELISFDKKVDLFNCCHKLYRYASIDCLQLLIQMIKSVDSSCSQILYKIINHAADTFEDPLFIQPPPYFLNLESTVINMNNEDRINFDKSIIVFLQEIVDIALQDYDNMAFEEQKATLDLICTAISQNIKLIEFKKPIFSKLIDQFEMIEQQKIRVPCRLLQISIRLLFLSSLKQADPLINLSKVMNIVDSLLMNKGTSMYAVSIICELLLLIFCNNQICESKNPELCAMKEVLIHTLFKCDSSIEIIKIMPLIINKNIEPYFEKVQTFIFQNIFEKGIWNSVQNWFYILWSICSICNQHTISQDWYGTAFNIFIRTEILDHRRIMLCGAVVQMIFSDKEIYFSNMCQLNHHTIQVFKSKIIMLLIQMFKLQIQENSNEIKLVNHYISWLLKRLESLNIIRDYTITESDIQNLEQLKNLTDLDLFYSFGALLSEGNKQFISQKKIKIHMKEVKYLLTVRNDLLVFNSVMKYQLYNKLNIQPSEENLMKFIEYSTDRHELINFLFDEEKFKYSFLMLCTYFEINEFENYNVNVFEHLSLCNQAEWCLVILSKQRRTISSKNKKRLKQYYGTQVYKFHKRNTKRNSNVRLHKKNDNYCLYSIVAGTYLFEIKSETKLKEILKNKKISSILYHQWINMCFNNIISELKIQYKNCNKIINHLNVPPFLKIIIEKLIQNFKFYKDRESRQSKYELLLTVNGIAYFLKRNYDLQIEGFGRVNMFVIQNLIMNQCLKNIVIKDLLNCCLNNAKLIKRKLDDIEQFTQNIYSILCLNHMWYKIDILLTQEPDLKARILRYLFEFDNKLNAKMQEVIISEKLMSLIDSKKACVNESFINVLQNNVTLLFLKMSSFHNLLYADKLQITSNEENIVKLRTDKLLDYRHLKSFIQRLNLFGFSNKYQFEELINSMLIGYNLEYNEMQQTSAEYFSCKRRILESICNLITLCYKHPNVRNNSELFIHSPRTTSIEIDKEWIRKLYRIYCNSENDLRTIFNLPNLERSYKNSKFITIECGRNQYSISKYSETWSYSDVYKILYDHLDHMNIDVNSSIRLLMEALSDRLLQNYAEVLQSISKLVEFCVMKDRLNNLNSYINKIKNGLSAYDTLAYQHVIYLKLKCWPFQEYLEISDPSYLTSLISTFLKNKQLYIRIATLDGLLGLLQSMHGDNNFSIEKTTSVVTLAVNYLYKMIGNFTYCEIHDQLIWTLLQYLTCNNNFNEVLDRFDLNLLRKSDRIELTFCILQSLESSMIQQAFKERNIYKVQMFCIEMIKSENIELTSGAIQTLVTTLYADLSSQIEMTQESNGVVQHDLRSNLVLSESINNLLQLLRISPLQLTKHCGNFLYYIIVDLIRPQDILHLILKEFLDCFHPFPMTMAKLLWGVLRSAIHANSLFNLEDYLLSILKSVLNITSLSDRVFRLTVLFSAVSEDRNFNLNHINTLDGKSRRLIHQDSIFISSAIFFYSKLSTTKKENFILLCKNFEKDNIDVYVMLKSILK